MPQRHATTRTMHALAVLALALVGPLTIPLPSAIPSATAEPLATRPFTTAWPGYDIILWHRQPASAYATLPRLGYSGALVFGQREALDPAAAAEATAPLRAAGLRWYVENIATDFYSPYHRWVRGQAINQRFLEAQQRYRLNPADPAAFEREPGLGDPAWLARIATRMAEHARLHLALAAPQRPFFLNLGDEPGIADLSAAWDFDRGPAALAGFRAWLATQYPSLAALNAEWGTSFADWAAVLPATTDAAIAQHGENFAGWADFKAWMDLAFAAALRAGREAVRAVDPRLPVGIAGGQAPGWGGWDYGLLSQAVDLIETYDYAGNATIARGLNPDLLLLSTSFNTTPDEWHRLWRQVLLGMRGAIIWDGEGNIVGADGTPGPRGLAALPAFTTLRGGISAQLLASEPVPGAVGILYSQASFRLTWLLDRRREARAGGPPWAERGAEAEHNEENAWRAALRRAIRALDLAGVTPRWLTPDTLSAGLPPKLRVLILPHTLALGPDEAAAIHRFAAAGGVVLADAAEPGGFNARGSRLATPALDKLALRRPGALLRETAAEPWLTTAFADLLAEAGAAPGFQVLDTAGQPVTGVETREYRNGGVRLLALQRDFGAPDPGPVTLRLAQAWQLHQLGSARTAPRVGQVGVAQISLALDPVLPTILSLSPEPLPPPILQGPGQLALGEPGDFVLGLAGPSPAAAPVLRIDLHDPDGTTAVQRGWNLVLRGGPSGSGGASWTLPAGALDHPGTWTLRVTEMLGGGSIAWPIAVAAP